MSRSVLVTIIILAVVLCAAASYAASDTETTGSDVASYRTAMGNKAERGVKNILFGWTEAPKRIVDITKETNNPIWGLFAGTFQGVIKAMARTASGVSDVVTAPISPEKEPLMQADIAVE